jgi:hypothetical protein
MKKILSLLILFDGKPGHESASKGVQKSLEKIYAVETTIVPCKLKFKGSRPLLRWLLNSGTGLRLPRSWQLAIIRSCYILPASLPTPLNNPASWLVSTGGDTSFLNAWLAKLYDIQNVYCSSLRGLDPSLFKLLISTSNAPQLDHHIRVKIAPTPIDRDEITLAGRHFREKNQLGDAPVWALLIGGTGSGFTFTKKDLTIIADNLLRIAEIHGAQILLTTSRRTGIKLENALRKTIGQHPAIIAATYFNHHPERVMAKYLGAADLVFCTAESGSMLSESIASGKATYALFPSSARPTAFYSNFLRNHSDAGRLILVPMNQLTNLNPTSDIASVFHPITEDPTISLAKELRFRLKGELPPVVPDAP